jgi:hypothetical protein
MHIMFAGDDDFPDDVYSTHSTPDYQFYFRDWDLNLNITDPRDKSDVSQIRKRLTPGVLP